MNNNIGRLKKVTRTLLITEVASALYDDTRSALIKHASDAVK